MKIRIERFKNIKELDIDASGLTLLVGGNNSGKSSVLQAIQFGVSVAQTSALQGGGWSEEGRLATSIGQSDLIYSPIKDVLSLARNGRLREQVEDAIAISYTVGGTESRASVMKGRNKNIRLELVGRELGEQLQSIQNPFCALVTGLAGIPSEEAYETNVVVRKAAAMGDSNSVFRNILLQLSKQDEKWNRFRSQLARMFPGYDLTVTFNHDVDEKIICTVVKDGNVYPIDTCGTGVLQAIQIFAYINLFSPKLLLLDEPDSHLHPNNQKQLARELIMEAENGLSVIVSTHSKHLVEALIESSHLVWLKNGNKAPQVDNYELRALLEIGALNAGERIGNPTYIFLTEDEKRNEFEVLLEANGYDLEECEVVAYSGCTNRNTAIALLNHLRKSNPEAKFAVHRDRDFLTPDELDDYRKEMKNMNVKVFFPIGNDVESHFITAAHVAAVCNVDEDVASEVIASAFAARKDALLERYVNSRIENEKRAGRQINAGLVSVEAANLLTGPDSQAVHGKLMLKAIRNELQRRGIAGNLISSSPALATQDLKDLWAQ